MTDDFELEDERPVSKGRRDAVSLFESQVNKRIKQLRSKSPAARREAAYWLGESGEPKAIDALRIAYKTDKDKGVRDAAKYALGMFRALEKALDGSEEQQGRALLLIEQIINEGKMGRRSRISPGLLVRIEIGLVVLLVVLVGLNLVISGAKSGPQDNAATRTQVADIGSTAAGPDPVKVIEDLRTLSNQIRADATKLSLQLQSVQSSGTLECTAAFNNPASYSITLELNRDYPAIAAVAGQLNTAQSDLAAAKKVFDEACKDGAAPLTAEQAAAPLTSITDVMRLLTTIDGSLADTASLIPATAAPVIPTSLPITDTPTPTETPTTEPTATIDPNIINRHLSGLEFIISDITRLRGSNSILKQYWADVSASGTTGGCREPRPLIPEDYPPLDEATAKAVPDLKTAVDQVNLGLTLVRQAWTFFSSACTNNTLQASEATGLQLAQTASDAFTSAKALVDAIRAKK